MLLLFDNDEEKIHKWNNSVGWAPFCNWHSNRIGQAIGNHTHTHALNLQNESKLVHFDLILIRLELIPVFGYSMRQLTCQSAKGFRKQKPIAYQNAMNDEWKTILLHILRLFYWESLWTFSKSQLLLLLLHEEESVREWEMLCLCRLPLNWGYNITLLLCTNALTFCQ